MKSQIKSKLPSNTVSRHYPCILELASNKGIVALFPEEGSKGIVLSVGYADDRIGKMEEWLDSNTTYWKEFTGAIELSN